MILDIDNVSYGTVFNCLEDLVVTYANYLNFEYRLMFIENWKFNYIPFDSTAPLTLGIRINTDNTTDTLAALDELHGVRLNRHNFSNTQDVLEFIDTQINTGMPVTLCVDPFWVPWDVGFQKYHGINSGHYFLCVGIDTGNNALVCSDPFFGKKEVQLPVEYMEKGCEGCFTLSIEKKEQRAKREILDIAVANKIDEKKNINIFKSIRDFCNELSSKFSIEEELAGYDLESFWRVPFYSALDHASNGRKKFAVTLKYLGKENPELEAALSYLSDSLNEIGEKWDVLKSLFVKMALMSDCSQMVKRLADKMSSLADEEEEIFNKLKQVCIHGCNIHIPEVESNTHNDNIHIEKDFSEILFVDLKNYLNNKGIGTTDLKCQDASFDGAGNLFICENIPHDGLIQAGEIKFQTYISNSAENDNVTCWEQTIPVNKGRYSAVMYLGTSTFGNYADKMEVLYTDGFIESVDVKFIDWTLKDLQFGEKIVLQGHPAYFKDSRLNIRKDTTTSLFTNGCILKHDGVIDSIRLPLCPNIHLFGISLCR